MQSVLIMKEYRVLSIIVFESIERVLPFFFFNLVVYYINGFWDVNPNFPPWNKSHLLVVYNFLFILLDRVC